jgi:N-acetylglucosaminyl-diphospho-decaprenol L-rhamnosyltransferase
MAQGPPTASAPPPPAIEPAPRRTAQSHPSPAVATPHLSVVIVNFCQWRNTLRLTRQLRDAECVPAGRAELVIVDNHSPADPLLERLRRAAGVSLRRFSRNRGFATAVNEGCRLGRGGWLLLLNPDMSVAPGFLDRVEALARQLEQQDLHAGVVGFRLTHPDGSRQASCGPFPTLFSTIAGLFLPRAERKCRVVAARERTRVAWATGCCLLVRRECLLDLGGFDEDYFLYYEDVDLCRRARERGWHVWFEPTLEVTHHSPLHLRSVPAPLRLMTRHALLTYSTKHWPRWQSLFLGGLMWLEACGRQAAAALRLDGAGVRHHRQLRKLVGDIMRARPDLVRGRLRAVAGSLVGAAAAQDGNAC